MDIFLRVYLFNYFYNDPTSQSNRLDIGNSFTNPILKHILESTVIEDSVDHYVSHLWVFSSLLSINKIL